VTPQQQQIVDACKATFAKAKGFWPHLNFDNVGIRFDLRGRCAGMAHRRGGHYFMRFNSDMLTREAFDHILNDTVPHEIAHIVCFMDPSQGRNHDYGWASVCRRLGGTGARCHKEEVVYGKGLTYEYTTTRGHAVRVSQQIHNRIQQRNATYTYKGGKGAINKNCAHQVVGSQGRTLAAPVRKVEAKEPINSPKSIETAFRTATPQPTPAPVSLELRLQIQERINALRARQAVQPTPVAPVVKPAATFDAGASKASICRAIMLSGHRAGKPYEEVIEAIMAATGWPRQQTRATYKNNCAKVGIPVQ